MASLLDAHTPGHCSAGKKIGQLVEKITKKNCFSEIAMPFGVVAVDLITGKKVVFSNISSAAAAAGNGVLSRSILGSSGSGKLRHSRGF